MGPGFFPLAERLALGPGSASPWLQQGMSWLGAEVPYTRATALLHHFTGTTVSRATVRRTTVAIGHAVQQVEAETVRAPVVASPLPLQVSVDGSMLAIVGEGWREVRLASIGVVTPAPVAAQPPRTTQLSYVAALCDAETFQQTALGEVLHRGLDQATRVAAISDGAPWIQGFVDYHCPQAIRILDFAHAAGYLAQAAQASFGPGTVATSEWFTTQRQTLRHGVADEVLAALARLPASDERDTALHYLRERRPMLDYPTFAAAGWPLGSGCVESAHKHVLQSRMKGPGMRWALPTARAMIALRVSLANGRWDAVWPQVGPHQRQTRRARSVQRRGARRPPAAPRPDRPAHAPPRPSVPARPKLVQDGRPTADHPWRRRLSFFAPHAATKM